MVVPGRIDESYQFNHPIIVILNRTLCLASGQRECSYYWALSAIPAGNYISSRINLPREVRLAIVPVNDQMYYAIDQPC